MNKDIAYINKIVKKKQHERSMQYHLENIRNVRPLTKPVEGLDININNRKKQYQNEMRFTEIQRENRILLEKISSIMNKTKRGSFGDRNNKSLNSTYRRKQNQDIQIENARLLKRLQEKKPNYQTERLNKQWIGNKNVMKIMSNFPFTLTDRPKHKRNSISHLEKQRRNTFMQPIQIVRMRVLNGFNFLITVQLSAKMLRITGDCKQRKQVKVIEIQRSQAIQFIQEECHSKLDEIFSHLRYDKDEATLYLVGNQVKLSELLAKERGAYGIDNVEILENEENQYKQQREDMEQQDVLKPAEQVPEEKKIQQNNPKIEKQNPENIKNQEQKPIQNKITENALKQETQQKTIQHKQNPSSQHPKNKQQQHPILQDKPN